MAIADLWHLQLIFRHQSFPVSTRTAPLLFGQSPTDTGSVQKLRCLAAACPTNDNGHGPAQERRKRQSWQHCAY